jgi:hypothetical protein
MDAGRFDALTRALSAGGSRRAGLATLLGGALGLLGLAPAAGRRARPRRQGQERRRRVSAQGPCGDGSAKDNTCRRHRQCCTGYCRQKKNKEVGRCRCKKLGKSCREDRNCCAQLGQPMTCRNGACQAVQMSPPPPQPGQTCAETCAGCCNGSGQCQNGTSATACGSGGVDCDSCVDGEVCCGGVCRTGLSCCDAGSCPSCQTCTTDGVCVATTGASCGSVPACNRCSAAGTCEPVNEGGFCDDGDVCTNSTSCQGGSCVGTPIANCCTSEAQCDDGDPCTTNTCNTSNRCASTRIDACCLPVGSQQCTLDTSCCGSTGQPGGGVCAPDGCCLASGQNCTLATADQCCSGVCEQPFPGNPEIFRCACGAAGTPCGTTGAACCTGFSCLSGFCQQNP